MNNEWKPLFRHIVVSNVFKKINLDRQKLSQIENKIMFDLKLSNLFNNVVGHILRNVKL